MCAGVGCTRNALPAKRMVVISSPLPLDGASGPSAFGSNSAPSQGSSDSSATVLAHTEVAPAGRCPHGHLCAAGKPTPLLQPGPVSICYQLQWVSFVKRLLCKDRCNTSGGERGSRPEGGSRNTVGGQKQDAGGSQKHTDVCQTCDWRAYIRVHEEVHEEKQAGWRVKSER